MAVEDVPHGELSSLSELCRSPDPGDAHVSASSAGGAPVKLQLAGVGLDRTSVAKIKAGLRSVFDYELAVIAQQLKTTTDVLYPPWSDLQGALPDLLKGEKPVRTRKA